MNPSTSPIEFNLRIDDDPTVDGVHHCYTASATPNTTQKADMGAFVYAFAKRYFTVVRDILKKYDPNHLYLGCRFAWYTPEEAGAAGEVCDVVSFNLYAPRLAPKKWAFTQDLGKPCIIGEFHCGALDRGLFHPGTRAGPESSCPCRDLHGLYGFRE